MNSDLGIRDYDKGGGWGWELQIGWFVYMKNMPTGELFISRNELTLGRVIPQSQWGPRGESIRIQKMKKKVVKTSTYTSSPVLVSVSWVGDITNYPLAQARHLPTTDSSSLLHHTPSLLLPGYLPSVPSLLSPSSLIWAVTPYLLNDILGASQCHGPTPAPLLSTDNGHLFNAQL